MKKRIIGPYLEQQILSASPLQLISLSYQTAIQAVREARGFVAQKNIVDRVRTISLAHGVLAELYRSLDFKAGNGEIARDLGRLYDYMMRRLLEVNASPQDEPLEEVLGLLCSLAEVWEQVALVSAPKSQVRNPEPASPWGSADLSAQYESRSYSLSC